MRTVMVKRLYGKMRGMMLKKFSSYSCKRMAMTATSPRRGLMPGGNLPLLDQSSE